VRGAHEGELERVGLEVVEETPLAAQKWPVLHPGSRHPDMTGRSRACFHPVARHLGATYYKPSSAGKARFSAAVRRLMRTSSRIASERVANSRL
jgi:hypothetical protein